MLNVLIIIGFVVTVVYVLLLMPMALMFVFPSGMNKPMNDEAHDVSVLVPFRNEQSNLIRHYDGMAEQKGLTHLIYIDDHSEDHGHMLLGQILLKDSRVKLLSLSNTQGKKAALAKGLSAAETELIISTDADSRPISEKWLKTHYEAYSDGGIVGAAGPVAMQAGKDSFIGQFQVLEQSGLIVIMHALIRMGSPVLVSGANFSYRRSAFYKVGGYDGNWHEASGDDVFLAQKLVNTFGRESIAFLPDRNALVMTEALDRFSDLFHQKIRWVGKTGRSGPLLAKTLGLSNVLISLWLLFCGILSPFLPGLTKYWLMFLITRFLIDFLLLFLGTWFTGQQRSLRWYLPSFLFNQVFVIMVFFGQWFIKPRWKGRRI